MDYVIDILKKHYTDKINEDIIHLNKKLKQEFIAKQDIIDRYKDFLMDAKIDIEITKETEEEIKKEIQLEYLCNEIGIMFYKELKNELEKTVKNIKNIDLSSNINFISKFIEPMIEGDIIYSNKCTKEITDTILNETDKDILIEVLRYYKYLKKSRSSK